MRAQIAIRGIVQGVGFRPFVYRLANELGLNGFVLNSTSGVLIEVEGNQNNILQFINRLEKEKPLLSYFTSFETSYLDELGHSSFEIRHSEKNKDVSAFILPDIGICPDCLKEMFDTKNRRYLYPFINCTNCGPRFSIIESLPYDRPNTSMKGFKMCTDCEQEYKNPNDRRYHAQPIACPKCGPHLELLDKDGNLIAKKDDALNGACEHIAEGKIVALKGLGGFQLITKANENETVLRLRKRKMRDEKPFAIMMLDLDSVKEICEVSREEERLLLSTESPIVLLKKSEQYLKYISLYVAQDNPYLGVLLPYTPLHHLLMRRLKIPVIATSGNISEEPMCIDNEEALNKLKNIADYFLVHDRPIVRHVDDSIARIIDGREMILRRARGYAPLPILLDIRTQTEDRRLKIDNGRQSNNGGHHQSIIALGGHLKNTIALKVHDNIFISQHIGDLETNEANNAFRKVIKDFKSLYNVEPEIVVCDSHPEFLSTKYAVDMNLKTKYIQHHIAHIASCRAENRMQGTALGVAWDGTGLGTDGTIWGGEFFISKDYSIRHCAQIRQFPLPGGEKAIKEPRRSALGILFEMYGNSIFEKYFPAVQNNFDTEELNLLKNMLKKNINCPTTSSIGRLFDAVASITGISQYSNFEGQTAMKFEFVSDKNEYGLYSFALSESDKLIIDWQPLIEEVLADVTNSVPVSNISAKFHNTLVEVILKVAKYFEMEKVILSGGCFQNVLLLERTIKNLEEIKIKVYWHQRVPTNDGGIALGQIAAMNFGY